MVGMPCTRPLGVNVTWRALALNWVVMPLPQLGRVSLSRLSGAACPPTTTIQPLSRPTVVEHLEPSVLGHTVTSRFSATAELRAKCSAMVYSVVTERTVLRTSRSW